MSSVNQSAGAQRFMTGAAMGALALLLASQASAQTQAAGRAGARPASGDSTQVDEVVVTGTSIRGVAPIGSQLIQLDQAEIKSTGAQNTASLLATIPQLNSFGTVPRPGADGANPVNPPALRGLPAGATLSLLNGHRLVGLGTISTLADPTSIPIAAIQRVEVLADGASATYGSDAVAGVVNVILRRNLDGVDAQLVYGTADGYSQKTASVVGGKTWDSGSFLIGYQYFSNTSLMGKDRDYVTGDLRPFGGSDTRSTFTSPPNVIVNGQTYHYDGSTFAPGATLYDPNRDTSLIPASIRRTAIANFRQDVGERIHLFGDANWGHLDTDVVSGPGSTALTITSANPFFKSPVPGATSETVNYRFTRENGPYSHNLTTVKYYGASLGADIDITKNWHGQVFGNYGHGYAVVDQAAGTVIDAAALRAALASTNPATAFDPFDGRTSAATLAGIRGVENIPSSRQQLYQLAGHIDGTLFTLPGGDVRTALGVEFRRETYAGTITGGTLAARTRIDRGRTREVRSAYGEVFLPIVGDQNAFPGVRSLTVDGALRYDNYNDFGAATNPKIGANWVPVEGLTVRANYSKSFHAPSLADLNATDSRAQYITGTFSPNFFTPVSPARPYNVLLLAGGNPNLLPEKATTYSFGADFQPTSVPGLRLSATYFSIHYTDVIGIAAGAFTNPALLSRFIIANPTQAQLDAALASSPSVVGIPIPVEQIEFIDDLRRYNLGVQDVHGLDFSANYRVPATAFGDFDFGVDGNYYLQNRAQPAPGAPFTNNMKTGSTPIPRWRVRGSAGWHNGAWGGNLFVNHIGPFNNIGATPIQRVSAWTTFDANLSYDFGDFYAAKQVQLQVDVSNIFNTDPPRAYSPPGFIQAVASPLGRLVQVSLRTSF